MRRHYGLWAVLLVLSVLVARANGRAKIIDNGDEGYSQTGLASVPDAKAHGGDAAVAAKPTGKDRVRVRPGLAGKFDVHIYWRDYPDMDTDVRWTVHHAKGATTHSFSQRNNPGWHFHGTYQLDARSHVDLNGRNRADRPMVADAVGDRVCPERTAWWYPEKKDHIDVRQCYRGEDVWMGPYNGTGAHGGLDINMRSGTPLFAPIDFDDHYLFDSLKKGNNNNRWRGVRKWKNGATWWLHAHHLNKMVLPEHTPLPRGRKYAKTAGVHIGVKEHTHFVFRVFEKGQSYWIDPWILFWQTFRDNQDQPDK